MVWEVDVFWSFKWYKFIIIMVKVMFEEGVFLKIDELGINYGDLFNFDEEVVEFKL